MALPVGPDLLGPEVSPLAEDLRRRPTIGAELPHATEPAAPETPGDRHIRDHGPAPDCKQLTVLLEFTYTSRRGQSAVVLISY